MNNLTVMSILERVLVAIIILCGHRNTEVHNSNTNGPECTSKCRRMQSFGRGRGEEETGRGVGEREGENMYLGQYEQIQC